VPRPTITTHPITVTDTGHLTEYLYDDGQNDGTLVCAAHGGNVEPGTGEQAVELAPRVGATCWACFGYDGDEGAFDAFHPASSDISPEEYPLLDSIADRGFETVVSLHGLGDPGVIVGGGLDRPVKERVRDRLDAALAVDVEVVTDGEYAGASPDNFVNWLAADGAGLQLEEGPGVRAGESDAVLEVLVDCIEGGVL
jgi:phage replication-related protein YjqB (UPF0714/DUF867 family)